MRPILLVWLTAALSGAGSAAAATFNVDRFDDAVDVNPGDGLCLAAGGGCTLRAAVMESNAGPAADDILLPPGRFTLSLASGPTDESFGDLDVFQPLTLSGEGMRDSVVSAAGIDRVFEFHAGSSTLQHFTARDGLAAGGGGFEVGAAASVSCYECLLRDNHSSQNGGGARVQAGGSLALGNSIVAANESVSAVAAVCGGGIYSEGTLGVSGTRVTRNRVTGAAGSGGGLCASGTFTLTRSTVDDNDALAASGGGIVLSGGPSTLTNSTVSGNRAGNAGGLLVGGFAAVVTANNLSIVGNTASASAGGVWVTLFSELTLGNSIVADNLAPAAASADCLGFVQSAAGHNLIEDPSGCTLQGTLTGNVTGQDPQLLPLGSYGGLTPTAELSSTASPAWNAGDNASCATQDQRAHPPPRGTNCEIGATEFFGIVPVSLAIDPLGNRVLEPLIEGADTEPTMGSLLASSSSLTSSLASFGGPDPTVVYSPIDASADYGSILGGTAQSCKATGNCFGLFVFPAAGRPLRHWDASAREATSGPLEVFWRIHVGESFADVPLTHPSYRAIEALLHSDATSGCDDTRFCPDGALDRQQLALLLERARWGEFPPPFAATGQVFADAPAGDPYTPWIERLAADGASAGCTADPDGPGLLLPRFCPQSPVRRDQLAALLERMRQGSAPVPAPCGVQRFADVPLAHPFCPWIQAAAVQGHVEACAADPDGAGPLLPRYCPDQAVSRALLAAALARTFALELYSF